MQKSAAQILPQPTMHLKDEQNLAKALKYIHRIYFCFLYFLTMALNVY